MKNLRAFNTRAEYEAYLKGIEVVYPHISYVREASMLYFENPLPLYVEAIEEVTLKAEDVNTDVYYSFDLKEWSYLARTPSYGINNTIKIPINGKTYFYSKYTASSSHKSACRFSISGKCNIGGNIVSMVKGLDFKGAGLTAKYTTCENMFKKCTSIISARKLELPVTLSEYAFSDMFNGCTSLVEAPKLPATTLAASCYNYMFCGCTSLKKAPELPATTLASSCYKNMFYNCTSLEKAPELPAKTLASYCYSSMFLNCTSLVEAPKLPATTLVNGCYDSMFRGCTSLVKAPILPARGPVTYGYRYMFMECASLKYIKVMTSDLGNSSSTYSTDWVEGVSTSGVFVQNKDFTSVSTGTSGRPSGWTHEYAITFTINGTQYIADDGATWAQWINTRGNTGDNTDGYKVGGTNVLSKDGVKVMLDGVATVTTDVITSKGVYTLEGTETA